MSQDRVEAARLAYHAVRMKRAQTLLNISEWEPEAFAAAIAAADAVETARLREILEKIAGTKPPPGYAYWNDEQAADHYWALFDRCRRLAATALEPKS